MINVRIVLPNTFVGTTSGVLGNPNGIPDDFRLRSGGTFISDRIGKEKPLHEEYETCRSWCTTADESIFVYDAGTSHAFYNECDDPTFYIPPDVSDIPDTIKELCCYESRCILDYLVTGSLPFAATSRAFTDSGPRRVILSGFYAVTNGDAWDVDDGWTIEDPCANVWVGVTCVAVTQDTCPTSPAGFAVTDSAEIKVWNIDPSLDFIFIF